MEEIKVYVDVKALFSSDGRLIPLSIVWTDGREYEIAQVRDVCRAASLRAGGAGIRYTCLISGQETHFYYEGSNLWFVERRRG